MEQFETEKFKNAILFFAGQVENLGITKLNKLLYYSDFEHYRRYGRPILGDRYIKMEQGPVPSIAYALFNANFRDNSDNSLTDAVEVQAEGVFTFKRKNIVAKEEPDLSVFSSSELEVMRLMADRWSNSTARSISAQSHLEKPWQETPESEVIDYKLALDEESISKEYAIYREEGDRVIESILA